MAEAGPLAGLRVLDMTRFLSGPFATMALGDLGADVIKVEQPGTGDETRDITPMVNGLSHYYASVNRNKRSVELDLSDAVDRDKLLDLCETADVVIHNFRVGQVQKWGIDYDVVRARKPDVIYCSISGFGDSGPLAEKISFDIVAQAMTGVMALTGEAAGAPMKLGLPLGDLTAGSDAVRGVLAALYRRASTGQGTHVQVNLFSSVLALTSYFAGRYFFTGDVPLRVGNAHHSAVPYGVFRSRDGYVVIAAFNDKFWRNLCDALDPTDLSADPRFATYTRRQEYRIDCHAAVAALTSQHDRDALIRHLEAHNVPCAPVLDLGEAIELAREIAPGLIENFEYVGAGGFETVGCPISFADLGRSTPQPPPSLGEHNAEVLGTVVTSAEG